jgi:hypothetical protein
VCEGPEITKKADPTLTVFFALLGAVRVKSACRKLMKLTPDLTKCHL